MIPSLSVVLPALNEAAAIGRAVRSAWAAGADEVVVVDGGSADGTPAAARDSGAQVLAAPRGRAIQQNAGAAATTAEILLFLHADCALDPAAGLQLAAACSSPRVQAGAFRQRIEASGAAYRWLEQGNAWRVRWGRRPYGDQALFVRRTLFESVGGFPDVPFLEDLLLGRAIARRCRPVLLAGPLYVSPRHWQRRGVLRQTLRNWLILGRHAAGAAPSELKERYG